MQYVQIVLCENLSILNLNYGQYRAEDKPWYSLGHGIVLAYIGIGLVSSITMRIVLSAENARRQRGERDEVIVRAGDARVLGVEHPGSNIENNGGRTKESTYESVEAARVDKGDYWSGFRYSL